MKIFNLAAILLLRFYPPYFRLEFAAEMQAVLDEVIREARQEKTLDRMRVVWREGLGLLWGAVSEQWKRLRKELGSMKMETPSVRGSWLAGVLGGLPFFLYALAKYGLLLSDDIQRRADQFFAPVYHFARNTPIYEELLKRYGFSNYWTPLSVALQTIQWVFWALVVIMLLIGWRSGWPRWAAVWVGFFLVVVAENLIDLNQPGVLAGFIAVAAWLLLVVLSLLWQARRDALKGFLAVLPVVPMMFWWLSLDGIIGHEGPYYILIGFLMMVAIGAVVRIGNMKAALGVILPLILVISLGVGFGTVYRSIYPIPPPSVRRMLDAVLVEFLLLGIFTSPLWGLFLGRTISRKGGPA